MNPLLARFYVRFRICLDRIDPRYPARASIASEYLVGEGIEIGALHRPLLVSRRARVRFVDRMTVAELRKAYPEFEKSALVNPDIVDDGERLATVGDASVDFVIGSHLIEHCEDPIMAVQNWIRVLKPGGTLYLCVPDKRFTFDKDRPVTSWEHILADHREGPAVSRRAHYEEWARLVAHVQEGDLPAYVHNDMEKKYSIHFHVWTGADFIEMLLHCRRELAGAYDLVLARHNIDEMIVILRKQSGAP